MPERKNNYNSFKFSGTYVFKVWYRSVGVVHICMLLTIGQVLSQEYIASCFMIISCVEKILEQKMWIFFSFSGRSCWRQKTAFLLANSLAAAWVQPDFLFFQKFRMLLKSFLMRFRLGQFVRCVQNYIFFAIHWLTYFWNG